MFTPPQLHLVYNTLTNSVSGNTPARGPTLLVPFRLVIDESFRSRRCAKTTPPSALPLQCYWLPDGLNGVSDAIQDSKDEEERYDLVGDVFEEIRREYRDG
jgi:hypothetical protein